MPTHRQARKSGFSFSRNRMAALQVSPGSPASRSSCVGQRGRASSLRSIDYHSRTCLRQQKPGGKSAWSNACKPAQAHRPATRSRSLTQSLDARKGLFDARFARLSALPACAQNPYRSRAFWPCKRRNARSSSNFFWVKSASPAKSPFRSASAICARNSRSRPSMARS